MRVNATASRTTLWIWLVAALGAIAYAATFYPGAMPFDSGYLWWQARGGTTSNIHGVGMVWLWRATDLLLPGPAGMFVLQLALFWSGLALVATALNARTRWRIAAMFLAAAAPVCFVLMSHVWSDPLLMATLTCATGALLHARVSGRHAWLLAALALLFLPLTLRHNALPAVIPLLIYLVYLWISPQNAHRHWRRIVAAALAASLILQSASLALERTVDQRLSVFPATALWDLAAVSLDVGEILLPPASHGPALTLDDLAQAFEPYANTTLFARTHAGMRQPFFASGDPLNAAVRDAWLNAIVTHPYAYLAHRGRLARPLFGTHPRVWPRELVYFDGEYAYDGNPAVAPNTSAAHAWCLRVFDALRDTLLLAAWPYLLLALIALAIAWRRRRDADMRPAIAVLCSGLAYAAPLLIIAPAAELRYTGWSCLAALLGVVLVFAAPRRSIISAAYPPAP